MLNVQDESFRWSFPCFSMRLFQFEFEFWFWFWLLRAFSQQLWLLSTVWLHCACAHSLARTHIQLKANVHQINCVWLSDAAASLQLHVSCIRTSNFLRQTSKLWISIYLNEWMMLYDMSQATGCSLAALHRCNSILGSKIMIYSRHIRPRDSLSFNICCVFSMHI